MGDLAELRGLLTVITFFSCFVILVSAIPAPFLPTSHEYREVTVPQYFEAADIQNYALTYNGTVELEGWVDWSLGGIDWRLSNMPLYHDILLERKEYWWIFWIGTTVMVFSNTEGISRGQFLSPSELDEDFDIDAGYVKYSCKDESRQQQVCDMFFGFDTELYDLPSEALEAGDLYFLQGMRFDQVQTTINAWNVISMLLFFQMPNIHPMINALIAIPIWACIAYLVYVLILKAIPFVGD